MLQGTLSLDFDTSEGSLALVVYEVVWPDNEPGFLFAARSSAEECAQSERPGVVGVVINRYVF